jgi:hypothetical protein
MCVGVFWVLIVFVVKILCVHVHVSGTIYSKLSDLFCTVVELSF